MRAILPELRTKLKKCIPAAAHSIINFLITKQIHITATEVIHNHPNNIQAMMIMKTVLFDKALQSEAVFSRQSGKVGQSQSSGGGHKVSLKGSMTNWQISLWRYFLRSALMPAQGNTGGRLLEVKASRSPLRIVTAVGAAVTCSFTRTTPGLVASNSKC